MYHTIVEAVLAHGKNTPDKLAVGFKANKLTYSELSRQMKEFAYQLKNEYGIGTGDMVMLSAMSKLDYVVALLGIQYLGAISIPLDKSAKEENIVDIYQFISPKLLLSDSNVKNAQVQRVSLKELYRKVAESSEDREMDYEVPDENKVAEMLFTTGTTGKPKGAMLTYGNLYASTHNTWHGVNMVAEDVVLIPLPLNHSVGMRVLRTALYIGATIVLQNGFTFAKELEKNIANFQCTALVSVPASIELVYRQMQDKFAEILGGLRYIEFGAGSLSYDMKKKLTRILPNTTIYNTWGSTETGGAIFLNVTERPDKLTSLGKPADGIELKVVNSEGQEVTARDIDTAGRMVLRGKMQMAGYYNLPEINKETLVDGWLYTNDLVYTDEEGYVYMLGRADAIINVGGEKVSPIEVENFAQEFEEIRECACIGIEDPEGVLGQVPALFVVLEGTELDEDKLTKFLAEKMEKYKLPHKYIIMEELPRNRMKKLDYKALRRFWEENGDMELMNPVIRNILNRHSIRDFKEEQIPRAILEMIVKTGYHAPSGHNMQTWRFTVIQDAEKIETFKNTVAEVAKRKKVHFYGFKNPDTIILVSNDRRNENTIQDSACAAENMMLAAQSYGIGSAWNNVMKTICDEPEIRELLASMDVPEQHIVWTTIVMGYPAKPASSLAKKENVVKWI